MKLGRMTPEIGVDTPDPADVPVRPAPRRMPTRTYGFLGVLYVSQYLGLGFMTAAITMLRDRGMSLEDLALLQSIGMVWGLKILWAPVVDRFAFGRWGHYKGWLLICQALMVLSLLVMMTLTAPEDAVGPLAGLVLLFGLASATQDVAADALSARLLKAGRRGAANGIQQAGGYLGTLLGGGVTVLVYDSFGWAAALAFVVVFTAVPLLVILRYREHHPGVRESSMRAAYASMISLVRQPGAGLWMFVSMPLLFVGATSLAYVVVAPALIDNGASASEVALTTTVYAAIPAMGVSLLAGWAIGRWGRIPVLLVGVLVTVIALCGLMLVFAQGRADFAAFFAYGFYAAVQTIVGTVIYTVSMDYSRPESAGSDVTASMAFATILSMGLASGGLYLASVLGYATVGWIAVGLTVLGAALCVVHLRRHESYLLGRADHTAIDAG